MKKIDLKHTKGIWSSGFTDKHELIVISGYNINGLDATAICRIYRRESTMEGDACLISAAPDMLDFLLNEVPYGVMDSDKKNKFHKVIEKATGIKVGE